MKPQGATRRSGLFDLLPFLRQSNPASIEDSVPGVVRSELFEAELERELLRSDRAEMPLTLILIGLAGADGPAAEHYLKRLAEVVQECTRRTDSRGWYREGRRLRVGVLLFHTPRPRANGIIDKLSRRFAEVAGASANGNGPVPRLEWEIFAYPGETADGSEASAGEGEDASTVEPTQSAEMLIALPLPVWKRTIDILGASLGLLILSPLFALIALGIKLTSPGPVFFRQTRIGRSGQPFVFWKFRSMRVDVDCSRHREYLHSLITGGGQSEGEPNAKPMRKLDDSDSQITWFGHFLRRSSLDELPQLINVLRGEMSLVGPRPCLPYEAEKYQRWCRRRFDIIPGITGLWQVRGKNRTTFAQMIRLDILYARRQSLGLDLQILALTLPTVIQGFLEGYRLKRQKEVEHAIQA